MSKQLPLLPLLPPEEVDWRCRCPACGYVGDVLDWEVCGVDHEIDDPTAIGGIRREWNLEELICPECNRQVMPEDVG